LLKKLLRWARVTMAGTDSQQFPVQQIAYMDKTADSYVLFPFGMHANVDADALALLFAVNGDDSNKAILPLDPDNRPKPLAAGEVAFYHPATGSIIHFRASGDMDIDVIKKAQGSINITAVKVNIVASDFVNITTPKTNIIGDLDVSGDTTLGAIVTSNGKDISNSHTHIGSPTAPTGGVSSTGAPN